MYKNDIKKLDYKFMAYRPLNFFLALFSSVMIFMIFCSSFANAYTPGTSEEIEMGRQLDFDGIIEKLSSGGIDGNLGASLMILFSMIIPTFTVLIYALFSRNYFLKVMQYPALLCMFFALLVLFLQPERWLSGDWSTKVVGFFYLVGSTFSLISFMTLKRAGNSLCIFVLFSFLIGFVIFGLRGFVLSI